MNFLDDNQICAWAEEHGLQRGQGSQVSLPALPSVYRREYANGRRSGDERSAVEDLIKRLGPWEECLVLITEWGVWPSGEVPLASGAPSKSPPVIGLIMTRPTFFYSC